MPININHADSSDLVLIPGIGKKTAEAIISYRLENRGIKDIEELRAVKGLGVKRLGILRKYLTTEE
jgi:competence protein ComEA